MLMAFQFWFNIGKMAAEEVGQHLIPLQLFIDTSSIIVLERNKIFLSTLLRNKIQLTKEKNPHTSLFHVHLRDTQGGKVSSEMASGSEFFRLKCHLNRKKKGDFRPLHGD